MSSVDGSRKPVLTIQDLSASGIKRVDVWLDLIVLAGANSGLYKRIRSSFDHEQVEGWLQCTRDALETKATSTLHKRAASFLLYVRWCGVVFDSPARAFPLEEPAVYRYLSMLREEGAPATRAKTFLESATLVCCILEIPGLDDLSASFRLSGVAHASFKSKRLTQKARALTRKELIVLETGVFCAGSVCDQYFCGFVCWLVYTRTRFGDSSRIFEFPSLDRNHEGNVLYAETKATLTKTGQQGRRLRVALPVVAPAEGLTGRPWLEKWRDIYVELGLDLSNGLMPVPNGTGKGFTSRPLSSSEATVWLHEVLTAGGLTADSVSDLRTHSCRATLLSWCAKYGVKGEHRRLLGYHARPKDNSMLEYSRDAMAEPLRKLGEVLEAVARGEFLPDSSRSGYFRERRTRSPSPPDDVEVVPTEKDDSSSMGSCAESESDGSSGMPAFSFESPPPPLSVSGYRNRPIPDTGVFMHSRSGVWHLSSEWEGPTPRLCCGRVYSPKYTRMGAWPASDSVWCAQCLVHLNRIYM